MYATHQSLPARAVSTDASCTVIGAGQSSTVIQLLELVCSSSPRVVLLWGDKVNKKDFFVVWLWFTVPHCGPQRTVWARCFMNRFQFVSCLLRELLVCITSTIALTPAACVVLPCDEVLAHDKQVGVHEAAACARLDMWLCKTWQLLTSVR